MSFIRQSVVLVLLLASQISHGNDSYMGSEFPNMVAHFAVFIESFSKFVKDFGLLKSSNRNTNQTAVASLAEHGKEMCESITKAQQIAERMVRLQEAKTITSLRDEKRIQGLVDNRRHALKHNQTTLESIESDRVRLMHEKREHERASELFGNAVSGCDDFFPRCRDSDWAWRQYNSLNRETEDHMEGFWQNKLREYLVRKHQLYAEAQSRCGSRESYFEPQQCKSDCNFWFIWCWGWKSSCTPGASYIGRCSNSWWIDYADAWKEYHNYEKLVENARASYKQSKAAHEKALAASLERNSINRSNLKNRIQSLLELIGRGQSILDSIARARPEMTAAHVEIQDVRILLARTNAIDCEMSALIEELVTAKQQRLLPKLLKAAVIDVYDVLKKIKSSKTVLASLMEDSLSAPYRRAIAAAENDESEELDDEALDDSDVLRTRVVREAHLLPDIDIDELFMKLDTLMEEIEPKGKDCNMPFGDAGDGAILFDLSQQAWFLCEDGSFARGGCLTMDDRQRPFPTEVGMNTVTPELVYQCIKDKDRFRQKVVACVHNGKRHKPHETWTVGAYWYHCETQKEPGGFLTTLKGCVSASGMRLNPGMSLETPEFIFECQRTDGSDNQQSLRFVATYCKKNGKKFGPGESLVTKDFWYSCNQTGDLLTSAIGGCISENRTFSLGERFYSGSFVYQCDIGENRTYGQQTPVGCLRSMTSGDKEFHEKRASTSLKEPIAVQFGESWLESSEPFQYLIMCKAPHANTGATLEAVACRYTSPANRSHTLTLEPGGFGNLGGLVVACQRDVSGALKMRLLPFEARRWVYSQMRLLRSKYR